ncbi:MAG: hypothetical protein C5B45_02005 [Chlamydiae bacterium]|nr:MAG: hypothetical protein C5B45_02005 [Chlamydiota bacterium]
MASYIQNAFDSFIITPTTYVFDTLNRTYENTPLKKTCEVNGRFFKSLLKKPRDLAKGIEALGKCVLLTLKNEEFVRKVDVVVKKAGKCKGWLTLVGLSDQISNALNLRASNVISCKTGDLLVLGEKRILLIEGSTLRLIGQAPPSLRPNTKFKLQNGTLVSLENCDQVPNVTGPLSENEVKLHLGNEVKLHLGNEVFSLPNGTEFHLGNSPRGENESSSLKDIFTRASFRKSLSAWAGVYSSAFESIKFLKITKVVSAQNPFLQIGNLVAIIAGAFARLGDDHKQYQTNGLSLENVTSIAGNISVFMLGAIPLANKKGLCGTSPRAMFFCSTIATLTNLSSHFLKSMNAPRCRDIQ